MALAVRAVELHGQRMWERARVVKVLAFMQRHGLNTLVLHESDLVHQIVYPRAYFDPYALWSDLPSRRGENAIFNRRAYFEHLLKLAADSGVAVWVNVKEIGFSDEVLTIHPEVIKDGVFCPSEPFWTDYIGHKTNELFSDFPLLAGMIVSFGSQESRASRVQKRCRCELCATEPLNDWYSRLIGALHEPIARAGKQLAIRDFAYKPEDHAPLIQAVKDSPADVIFCIKAMPHDFYITFPDNPAIGLLERQQWVEYDVLGQFFGWGLMPCFVLDDMQRRFAHWARHGVNGGIFRIEWERINDLDCLDTLNETNLIAAAALAQGTAIDANETCRRWLIERGWSEQAAPWLARLLEQTLPIVRRTAYINDFVSADNSMLPRSLQRAWWGMENRDSLAVWEPGRAADLQLDRNKAMAYVAEKDAALSATKSLLGELCEANSTIDEQVLAFVRLQFAHFETWVEGLVICAKVCIVCRWWQDDADSVHATDVTAFSTWLAQLQSYATRIQDLAEDSRVPHQIVMLIDSKRARDVLRDGRRVEQEMFSSLQSRASAVTRGGSISADS